MFMLEPSNPLVLYVYMANMKKENVEEFIKFVEELGCYCSFLIAADLYLDNDDEFSGDYKKYIQDLNSKERAGCKRFFNIMNLKTISGTKANDFFNLVYITIQEIEEKEKKRIENEKKERERLEERAKKVCANTPASELRKDYLEKEISIIAKTCAYIKEIYWHYHPSMDGFTWQISDEHLVNLIDGIKLGNEFIFAHDEGWLVTDKACYKQIGSSISNWTKYCLYSDVKEIVPVKSYETFLTTSKDAFLLRKSSGYDLIYVNTFRGEASVTVRSLIPSLISEGIFEELLYDKKFFYCRSCKKVQVTEKPELLKKCPFCSAKTKDSGWMKTSGKNSIVEKGVQEIYNELDSSLKRIKYLKRFLEEDEIEISDSLGYENKSTANQEVEKKIYRGTDRFFCKSCGKQIQENIKFCNFCGAKIEDTIICKNCGKVISSNAKFCNFCGQQTKEE